MLAIFTHRDPDFRTARGFEKVFQSYSSRMIAICLSKVQDQEVSKEIVQEIFKSLWERKDLIQLEGSIENYLMRALKFKIIDHYRQTKIRVKAQQEYLASSERNYSTENTVEFDELTDHLEVLVDRLPCHCREVFMLRTEHGLSSKEIASKLMLSERMVNYHLAKSRDILKRGLSEIYFADY